MPVSQDVLNGTLRNLRDSMVVSFETSNHIGKILTQKARRRPANGTYLEATYTSGAPATGIKLSNGDEVAPMTRLQTSRLLRTVVPRLMAVSIIPNKDLDAADGDLGVYDLMERYPLALVSGAAEDLECFLLTGESAGKVFATSALSELITLNGAYSGGTALGTTNGLIDFVAPGSQTDAVLTLTKSTSYDWYNQFLDIGTSWATNGEAQWRKMERQCSFYGRGGKGVDLIVADPDTFANWDEAHLGRVRTATAVGPDSPGGTLSGYKLGNALVTTNVYLDRTRSSFSGTNAADGLAYFLNSEYFSVYEQLRPQMEDYKADIPDQDVVSAKFRYAGQYFCDRLNAQGVVTGGAT